MKLKQISKLVFSITSSPPGLYEFFLPFPGPDKFVQLYLQLCTPLFLHSDVVSLSQIEANPSPQEHTGADGYCSSNHPHLQEDVN